MEDPASTWSVIAGEGWRLAVVAVSLIVLFFTSLAEAALVRTELGRSRQLADEKRRGAAQLVYLVEHRQEVLASIIVLINLSILLASAYTTEITIRATTRATGVPGSAYWVPVTAAGMIVFILIFCELTPKTYAIGRTERVALATAPGLRAAHVLVRPFASLLHLIGMGFNRHLVVPIFGGEVSAAWARYTDKEVIELVAAGEAQGDVEEEERDMIEGVIEFADKVVREVMRPRTDMICIPAEAPLLEAATVSRDTGYSRLPVYEENVDHIIGIVYAKDMVSVLQADGGEATAGGIARKPAPVVPESKSLQETLHMMQRNRLHMVIVIDEYGGTAGLVTIEDLIEEIFGEIQDEYDFGEAEPVRVIDEDTVVMDARVSTDEVEDALGVALPEGDFDSVGGFILDQLGHLPETGEKVEWKNLEFTVEGVSENRIQVVRVVRTGPAEPEEEEAENGER
jgi:putative hemolysin